MSNFELSTQAKIQCLDGLGGQVMYLLVNHITNQITHLVFREARPPHTERLIPISMVLQSSQDDIQINCSLVELGDLEPYNFVEFIDAQVEPSNDDVIFWPYVTPYTHRVEIEGKRIPPHDLAFRKGAQVEATDGEIGKVDEFLVDPSSGHVTHIVMREGHLWESKEISIPISAVQHISEKRVYLNLDKATVELLPELQIRRRYQWSKS